MSSRRVCFVFCVFVFLSLTLLLIVTAWLTPKVGSVELDEKQLAEVIRNIRLPRLYLGMLAGAGLSLAGMTFQAIFRNFGIILIR